MRLHHPLRLRWGSDDDNHDVMIAILILSNRRSGSSCSDYSKEGDTTKKAKIGITIKVMMRIMRIMMTVMRIMMQISKKCHISEVSKVQRDTKRKQQKSKETTFEQQLIIASFRNRPTQTGPLRVVCLILSLRTRPQLQSLRTKCLTWRWLLQLSILEEQEVSILLRIV